MDRLKETTSRFASISETASLIGVNPETVRRWIRERRLQQDFYTEIPRGDRTEYFVLRSWSQVKSLEGLKRIIEQGTYREIIEKIGKYIEAFFGSDPGCLAVVGTGFLNAIAIQAYLVSKGHDISHILLSNEVVNKRELIQNTRVLIVDDAARSGASIQKAKQELQEKVKYDNLNIIGDIKVCVYEDNVNIADFYVNRIPLKDHLSKRRDRIKLNLI